MSAVNYGLSKEYNEETKRYREKSREGASQGVTDVADEELREAAGGDLNKDVILDALAKFDDDPEYMAHYRIEALRAASRIVAPMSGGMLMDLGSPTIDLAEQFAKWLESGKK